MYSKVAKAIKVEGPNLVCHKEDAKTAPNLLPLQVFLQEAKALAARITKEDGEKAAGRV